MQRIFRALKQTLRQSLLILGLMSFIITACVLIATQPSLAATPSQVQQQVGAAKATPEVTKGATARERAYEEQIEASENVDKIYAENLKEYRKANPDENIVQKAVEGAKDLVERGNSEN